MTPLTAEQQTLATQLFPLAMRWARRYRVPEPDIVATDACMSAAKHFDASLGDRIAPEPFLWTQVWRRAANAMLKESRRIKREEGKPCGERVAARSTPALDLRDEIEWHMAQALPAERRAMSRVLHNEPGPRYGLYRYGRRWRKGGEVRDE